MLIAESLQDLPIAEKDRQAERPVVISRIEGRVFRTTLCLMLIGYHLKKTNEEERTLDIQIFSQDHFRAVQVCQVSF